MGASGKMPRSGAPTAGILREKFFEGNTQIVSGQPERRSLQFWGCCGERTGVKSCNRALHDCET